MTVYIWNADAHAKNYSLLLDGPRAVLAPLYDSLPTRAYPGVDANLGMRIGNDVSPPFVGSRSWIKLATTAGLDPDQVLSTALPVRNGVAARFMDFIDPSVVGQAATRDLGRFITRLQRQVKTDPAPSATALPPAPSEPSDSSGQVWVEAYVRRDGTAVAGHYRERPART